MRKLLLLMLSWVALFALQAKFLMPDEAFMPKASYQDGTVEAVIELGEDIYLYEEKVTLEIEDGNGVVIAELTKDEPVDHHGDIAYVEPPTITARLAKEAGVSGTKSVTLLLSYQGCSERGICYEPLSKSYTFEIDTATLPVVGGKAQDVTETQTADDVGSAQLNVEEPVSETDRIAQTIKEGNVLLILATFFGFGLLLSLTPCVFPMIPILSSVIVSQGGGTMTTKRAFYLSLVYVLSMSVAYTVAGVFAGMFGANLQAAMQAPEVIVGFSLVFVLLSFSMFGMYELQMPNFLQAKLTSAGQDHKGVAGVAIMGFLSALIVGPCVAAPLAGALIYIGQTGDAVLGGMALFALSMGMGIPLLVVGTTAGRFMPKPGEWMDSVKAFFGVLLLGVSIWMMSRILPDSITMLLIAVLLVFVAVSLGAFEPIKDACSRCGHAFKKAFGLLVFMYATTLFIGGLTGAKDMLNPLEKIAAPERMVGTVQATAPKELSWTVIHSIEALDAELAKAKGKKVLLDFSAKWCTSCKELEMITFADPAVKAKMGEFILIKADVTDNTESEKALTKQFGLFGPPAIIFFDEQGKKIKGKEIIGYIPPEEFLPHLNQL
jgi:thiol:disulfide interchange protein DsbD